MPTSLQAETEQSFSAQRPSSGQKGHGLLRFTWKIKKTACHYLENQISNYDLWTTNCFNSHNFAPYLEKFEITIPN